MGNLVLKKKSRNRGNQSLQTWPCLLTEQPEHGHEFVEFIRGMPRSKAAP